MHVPGSLIIVGILIVALSLFAVIGVENITPFYDRQNFDDICNSYLAVIERDSGLTTAQKNQLAVELNAIGIDNVLITAPLPSTGNWGKKDKLVVTGNYTYTITGPSSYAKTTKTIPVKYDMGTVILTLSN